MPFVCWMLELLLLLLPAATHCQSGDGDTETEPRISCTSHIATAEGSLTCKLVSSRLKDDEDDDEDDGVERMTVCFTDPLKGKNECLQEVGDTVISKHLNPLARLNLTVYLKGGQKVTTAMEMKKIVKPRSPQVWNVTFNPESNQALIRVRTPYHNDYLKVENQLFQLDVWTSTRRMIQNISSSDTLAIDMEHLQENTEYHVKARAVPLNFLPGSWSEWSTKFTFSTPADVVRKPKDDGEETTYQLIVCLVAFVFLTSNVVFFWRNRIFMYVWPSIPHPTSTLVQNCEPNKDLLLSLKPEEFSALRIYPMKNTDKPLFEETDPVLRPAATDRTPSIDLCSTRSSDCCRSNASVSTEELELSAMQSRSCSNGDESLQVASSSPVDVLQLQDAEPKVFGASQKDEAYVTMSSFYQIK